MKIPQTFITGTILVGAGAYNTYKDYVEAPQDQKQRTLTRNIAALGAAALAVVSADRFMSTKFSSEAIQNFSQRVSGKIIGNRFVKSIFAKLMPKSELKTVKLEPVADIIADCTKDVSLTVAAGLTGIIAGLLVDRVLVLNKKNDKKAQATSQNSQEQQAPQTLKEEQKPKTLLPVKMQEALDKTPFSKVANEETKNLIMNTTKVFEAAGLMNNPFEMPSVILGSLDMAKEKNIQNIVEQTSTGIVAEALIPTFFISLTNSLTKNKTMWTKIPAMAASFFVGEWVGGKVGTALTHEIRDELFDIEDEEEDGDD